MKAEILAPAGSRASFDAALSAGADAVYMGLPEFGARAFAQNFTLEEAEDVIRTAHLADMKVYITMNTLLNEEQLPEAAKTAKLITEKGADALIIQDLGLLHYLHHVYPEIELHASTQLSVLYPEQIEKLKNLGVTRVVLAREATIDEIRACRKAGMELEVFVHGALCISYSGQCQFSRVRYDRSGNKGKCAQPCRMEYSLLEDGAKVETGGDYLLSPKDLSVLQDIPALEQAGVSSLKIEGRMKSPVYVYESVLKARKAQEGLKLSERDIRDLTLAFSRSFTKGHTFGRTGSSLMNPEAGSHQGIEIGTVTGIKGDRVEIRLTGDIHQNDGIRYSGEGSDGGGRLNYIYDRKGRLINKAEAGDVIEVPKSGFVRKGAAVRKTADYLLEKETERNIKKTKRQRPVDFFLIAQGEEKPVLLRAVSGKYEAQTEKMIAQKPVKRATEEADFKKQLSKTGGTWARAENIEVDIREQVFVPLKEINRLRDDVLEQLAREIERQKPVDEQQYEYRPEQVPQLPNLVEIMKREQNIPGDDFELFSQYPFSDVSHKASIHEKQGRISAHLVDSEIVADLNVTNSYALAALLEMGYKGAVLSEELTDEELKMMVDAFEKRYGFKAPAVLPVYGSPRLMIMKHCPVNTALKDGNRKNCSLCRQHEYVLKGKDGKKALLYGDPACQMQVFDEKKLDRLNEIPALAEAGIQSFYLRMTDEDREQVLQTEERFKAGLEKAGLAQKGA